jgi:hypothetical protein
MSPVSVGCIVFVCTFGGALLGMWLRTVLPPHHLDDESRATVMVGIGLIATMTALVLGLVTASAKSSFDAVDKAIKETAIGILTLDRVLARYGPETREIRQTVKRAIGARIEMIWPNGIGAANLAEFDPMRSGAGPEAEGLAQAVRSLEPHSDAQRALKERAQDMTENLLQARWLVLAGSESAVPRPFLVILLFWLTISFVSFGLFAPRNATVIVVLGVCALSVASALFLILEMDAPFDGLLRVSPDALRYVHVRLNE